MQQCLETQSPLRKHFEALKTIFFMHLQQQSPLGPTLIGYVLRSRLMESCDDKLGLFALSKNLTYAEESGASTFTLKKIFFFKYRLIC